MKVCILIGSPRKYGNTASLTTLLAAELEARGVEIAVIDLFDKTIKSCIGCRACQDVPDGFGCPLEDDMQDIFGRILESDLFVLATPIYSWYCTPPMKAMLDRLVYGMNKYYGSEGTKHSLWENKKCALLVTCGYPPDKGADLLEQGIVRYCRHSKLEFTGMLAVRDDGYRTEFLDDEKSSQARNFASQIEKHLKQASAEPLK
jgi:multimeric flavodoxin WrbA